MANIDADRIYIPASIPDRDDFLCGCEVIKTLAGKVAVSMEEPPEYRGGILLPDQVSENLRADSGVVVSSGVDWFKVGDRVLVRPYDGIWRESFCLGDYVSYETRFYGCYISPGSEGEVYLYDVSDSIVAKIPYTMLTPDDLTLNPSTTHVLLEREPTVTSEGGVHIPDMVQSRTNFGTVVKASAGCSQVKPGDRVVYHPEASLGFSFDERFENLILLYEESIVAIVAPMG